MGKITLILGGMLCTGTLTIGADNVGDNLRDLGAWVTLWHGNENRKRGENVMQGVHQGYTGGTWVYTMGGCGHYQRSGHEAEGRDGNHNGNYNGEWVNG